MFLCPIFTGYFRTQNFRGRIAPDQTKLNAISKFPTPKKVKDVQSFLGLCNYYRKFVKDFSIIAKPLYNLTKKGVDFIWDAKSQNTFEILKSKLISAPVLAHFQPNEPTELRVDASKQGIGAVLLQKLNGDLHPVAYISRGLTEAEKNYSVTEQECLGILWSSTYLRQFIYGKPVKIVTDHSALCWLKHIRDATGRLARWSIKLQDYDYTVQHKNGIAHRDADCLKRRSRMRMKR